MQEDLVLMSACCRSAKTLDELNEFGMEMLIEAINSKNHFLWNLVSPFDDLAWQVGTAVNLKVSILINMFQDKPEKFMSFLEAVVQVAESKMMSTKHGMHLFAIVVGPLFSGMNAIKWVFERNKIS